MPFDALIAVTPRKSVSDALERLNLTPVPWEELTAHKQAQQLKFGPSFWHRHQTVLSLGLIFASPAVGVIVGATQGFTPQSSTLAVASSFAWMCLVALVTGTGLVRLRAGSHWEERLIPASYLGGGAVPEPIARVARALQRDIPDAAVILGELKRDQVVLDPYLLLECGDECVCLGIWEEGKVIACAG
jgi:hypothetical protein